MIKYLSNLKQAIFVNTPNQNKRNGNLTLDLFCLQNEFSHFPVSICHCQVKQVDEEARPASLELKTSSLQSVCMVCDGRFRQK